VRTSYLGIQNDKTVEQKNKRERTEIDLHTIVHRGNVRNQKGGSNFQNSGEKKAPGRKQPRRRRDHSPSV
jgi:hypothetical protein